MAHVGLRGSGGSASDRDHFDAASVATAHRPPSSWGAVTRTASARRGRRACMRRRAARSPRSRRPPRPRRPAREARAMALATQTPPSASSPIPSGGRNRSESSAHTRRFDSDRRRPRRTREARPGVSATISVPPSGVITVPFGNGMSSAATSRAVGSDEDHVRAGGPSRTGSRPRRAPRRTRRGRSRSAPRRRPPARPTCRCSATSGCRTGRRGRRRSVGLHPDDRVRVIDTTSIGRRAANRGPTAGRRA